MSDFAPLLNYAGQARLFPLPNLVFFPHVMQPLHIFEPRYRQMTADALAGDRLIALVLPQAGWEKDYAGQPQIHSIACLGRILADHRLEDGRFNILLRGQARIRILQEITDNKLYRTARIEVLHETPMADSVLARRWRKRLMRKAPSWLPKQEEVVAQVHNLLQSDLGLGTLCDILAFALPLEAEFKQALLEELDVGIRMQRLHDYLDAKPAGVQAAPRAFPPEFSVN
jgi:Lon protease-like protein